MFNALIPLKRTSNEPCAKIIPCSLSLGIYDETFRRWGSAVFLLNWIISTNCMVIKLTLVHCIWVSREGHKKNRCVHRVWIKLLTT